MNKDTKIHILVIVFLSLILWLPTNMVYECKFYVKTKDNLQLPIYVERTVKKRIITSWKYSFKLMEAGSFRDATNYISQYTVEELYNIQSRGKLKTVTFYKGNGISNTIMVNKIVFPDSIVIVGNRNDIIN